MRWRIALAALCLWTANALAADDALTLETALASATAPHPDRRLAEAQRDLAESDLQLADSQFDARLSLEGALRSGRNEILGDRFEADHNLRLNLRKPLWDGGRVDAGVSAARLEHEGRNLQLLDATAQRRLDVMTRFFEVLLIDQQYAADDEFMAVAYVSWDNARERHQLGEISTAALAELEARFQETRLKRNDTLRRVREKRALLAAAMNQPGELPSELREPELKANDRPLPDFEALLTQMNARNPRLLAQKQLLAASVSRLDGQRADNRPSLEFEAEAATWSRAAATRDNLRAGLNLVWPLYQGNRTDARIGREQAQFHLLQAQYDRLALDYRQALYETWQEIEYLRNTERRAASVNAAWRDWALEKARAEYELELKTNLGNSMAETQVARQRGRAVEYRLALAWERLSALLGGEIPALQNEERKS